MIKISLSNTLTGNKEVFVPIDSSQVRMYVCGPTAYDRPHLGNARSAVVYDLLFRVLRKVYRNVIYVRNITDVDDKIIAAVKASKSDMKSLTVKMIKCYHDDIAALNCLPPTYEPKACDYIPHMIKVIERLLENGNAYIANNHALFSINSYKDYGKLSNRTCDEMISGARVEIAPFKKDPADFVLWKPSIQEEYKYSFDSPWGRGRPGWHTECVAMSRDLLGEVFDIHGGGADLMFPHHENEIAQSECSSQHSDFVRYWVHNGFLMVEGEKMSKSLGNFRTVRELLNEGIEGVVIRYLCLTTHYRKPLDFTKKALEDSMKSISRFRDAVNIAISEGDEDDDTNKIDDIEFIEILADDLNTSKFLSYLHDLSHKALNGDIAASRKVKVGCKLSGLDLTIHKIEIPKDVEDLAELRLIAKNNKNWTLADNLRKEIEIRGFEVNDTKSGYKINKKNL
jgi:cysteinyl-tRNA synthetase